MASKAAKPANALVEKLKSRERSNYTFSLDERNVEKLKEIAKGKNLKLSHIVDELISDFLRGYENEKNR